MSDDRRLEISQDVASAAGVPADLDATQREPYTIPSTVRRRRSAWVYLAAAASTVASVAAGLPAELLVAAVALVGIASWHLASSWRIDVLDPQALEEANRAVDFAVGHASAAIGFDTWRARPVWNVLVFNADEPPTRRGLVRVDAVDGHVIETYTEDIDGPA